ncbi:MAG: sodium:solute symporter [Flammeovirgaceae bacterium]|nr:sodium:solute symporter [Flammeovirgaceae bacterium]MDW8287622.1 sodium:solute symporter [Flammeovirgaceae bacterium]
MSRLDWTVLSATVLFIVGYGLWRTKKRQTLHAYLLDDKEANWFTIAISIMATQASAITFLSAPGQAYVDGMRFVQFYFGLPLAVIVLCAFVVPKYYQLNVFTAYEYLEKRFDLNTRLLTAALFLLQRGLAAGFTIFAPSLILSSILQWNIYLTNFLVGALVVLYTVVGGAKAVSVTQKQQMFVIFLGMLLAGVLIVDYLPTEVSFSSALQIAGKMGKLKVVDFSLDWKTRYNVWSGLIGGFFLSLSYFGTDQSQVQRYLSGSSITQSRLGLIFNGMFKIPMQFLILFIGVMVYVFYLFYQPPLFFNTQLIAQTKNSPLSSRIDALEKSYTEVFQQRRNIAFALSTAFQEKDTLSIAQHTARLQQMEVEMQRLRQVTSELIRENNQKTDTNDTNYIFLNFVRNYLPEGLVGLLVAVIIFASMSSTSAELNALASTSVIDFYKRIYNPNADEKHYVGASRFFTFFWGTYAIIFAMFANRLGTLIEAVNILGSLVYGTILGIFMTAFFLPNARAKATFWAAILSEAIVVICYFFTEIPFLWFNAVGCVAVMLGAALFSSRTLKKA